MSSALTMWLGVDLQVEMVPSPLLPNDIKISDAIPIPMPLCVTRTLPILETSPVSSRSPDLMLLCPCCGTYAESSKKFSYALLQLLACLLSESLAVPVLGLLGSFIFK